ncbi:hypothetical protein [Nocardia sp. alder85J]|uniref:hypothetical protein n=1 Tax=Nocardia sp. alder85J TaxID=2862949 RepID=UPI001CD72956|nr:hypothetical protein [Nocardia sp. alder85J]MCX4096575.1 hypothetical protein [Nocardia sp. alder85J]
MTLPSMMKSRRMAARIAIAGVVIAAPLTALAVPAFAATTDGSQSAVAIDWNDNGPGPNDHRDHDGPRDDHRDHGQDQPAPPAPQPPLPPTGSFG